ncbi:MAG: DUF4258 domain-containing protein [Chloroflexota bacterium]
MPKLIMTHHAIERKWQRRISQRAIEQAVSAPDGSKQESDGDTQFHKTIGGRKVHVVAHPKGRNEWLIKTVWVDDEPDPHPVWKFLVTTAVTVFLRRG